MKIKQYLYLFLGMALLSSHAFASLPLACHGEDFAEEDASPNTHFNVADWRKEAIAPNSPPINTKVCFLMGGNEVFSFYYEVIGDVTIGYFKGVFLGILENCCNNLGFYNISPANAHRIKGYLAQAGEIRMVIGYPAELYDTQNLYLCLEAGAPNTINFSYENAF